VKFDLHLSAIKGVGEAAVTDILIEREKSGPFKNIFDLTKRVNSRSVNKKNIESLAQAGAFDSFPKYTSCTIFL
jgi:DNA polymerase-3 subunit alpha